MTIVQSGAVNTTALITPGLLVQIVPPGQTLLNGVPTNLLGIVGTASWGPVNQPVVCASMADFSQNFGPVNNRKFDLLTGASLAVLQGANNMRGVRVTDGTDTAASIALLSCSAASPSAAGTGYVVNDLITLTNGTILKVLTVSSGAVSTVGVQAPNLFAPAPSSPVAQSSTTGIGTGATFTLTNVTAITLTAKYTGTFGNQIQATFTAGSSTTTAAPTYKLTAAIPGQPPEIFDNLGGTGAALWTAAAAAINSGQSGLRGPSQLLVATTSTGAGAPAIGANFTLAGGTDGTGTITSAVLVGVDTTPRKGMYALRGTGCSVAFLADADDTTAWSAQVAYGLSEGTYMIGAGPSGDTIANAPGAKQTAGIDSYAFKELFGDWLYWADPVNLVSRYVSPQGANAGLLANLAPHESSLNKPLYGFTATQRTASGAPYSRAETDALIGAGIDVIANPSPGGNYFSAAAGHNSSSNPVIHGDNYTRMTNFLAATLNSGMGLFVGKPITPSLLRKINATLDIFLNTLSTKHMISDYSITCDSSNNPSARTALGYAQADVKVVYLGILEQLIVNIQGGQSVQITRKSLQLAA